MSDSREDRLTSRMREVLAEFYGREPRWRCFQRDGGPMFVWTVEPFGSGGLCDTPDPRRMGRYASLVYEPVGRGSRSGTATTFRLAEDSESLHELRRDAKARALRLLRAWQAGERRRWR